MATEKLTRAVISGPLTAMDDAIRALMLDREFQPLQASTTLGGRGELQVPDTDDVYRPVLDSAVALLGKLGIAGAESNLGTAIRTCVVLVMAWGMVFVTGKAGEVRTIGARAGVMLALSGVATGASWLCYYRALQLGPLSAVASIDRMSLLVAALLARVLLGERFGRREGAGLAVLTAGTVLMVLG